MFIQPKTFRGYKEALPKTFHTFPDSFENGDFSSIRFSLLSIPYVNSQFLGTKEAGYQTQSLDWSFFFLNAGFSVRCGRTKTVSNAMMLYILLEQFAHSL